MGIVGLASYLRQHAPHVLKEIVDMAATLDGKLVLVEVSGFMHRNVHSARSVDDDSHLAAFVAQYDALVSMGASPFYVFDGARCAAKSAENDKRSAQCAKRLKKAKKEIKHLNEEIEKLAVLASPEKENPLPLTDTQGASPTQSPTSTRAYSTSTAATSPVSATPEKQRMATAQLAQARGRLFDETKKLRTVKHHYYKDLQRIFRDRNIPFCIAIREAEKACAWIAQQGYGDIVITDDIDALTCGAPVFLQHFQSSRFKARLIRLDAVQEALGMTYAEFVDYCILCGSDFTSGKLKGIGPKTGRDIINEFKSIEAYLQSDKGKKYTKDPRILDEFPYQVARTLFNGTEQQVVHWECVKGSPFEGLLAGLATPERTTVPHYLIASPGVAKTVRVRASPTDNHGNDEGSHQSVGNINSVKYVPKISTLIVQASKDDDDDNHNRETGGGTKRGREVIDGDTTLMQVPVQKSIRLVERKT